MRIEFKNVESTIVSETMSQWGFVFDREYIVFGVVFFESRIFALLHSDFSNKYIWYPFDELEVKDSTIENWKSNRFCDEGIEFVMGDKRLCLSYDTYEYVSLNGMFPEFP